MSINKIEKIRNTLLEVCKTNIDVDWNCAEAQEEFSDMYDLINLLFTLFFEVDILENFQDSFLMINF